MTRLQTCLLASMVSLLAVGCGDDDAPLPDAGGMDAGESDAGDDAGGDAGDDAGDDDAGPEDAGIDTGPPGPPCAELLGLYADSSCETLEEGILEYSPRFWLWSDATDKERFIRFPEDSVIDTRDRNAWIFPVGTKIWKTFSLDGRRLETRVMEKTASGFGWLTWQFRTYRWSEDQRSVSEVMNGEADVLGTGHDIPSQTMCVDCHGQTGVDAFDAALGLGTIQLAHDDTATNLESLDDLGFLSETVPREDGAVPGDEATVAALGYLHANCGHCHSRTSFTGSGIRLWLEADLDSVADSAAYQTAVRVPSAGTLDTDGMLAARVAPGDPERSAVVIRMRIRGPMQMPRIATEVVHTEGLEIIEEWIRNGTFPE